MHTMEKLITQMQVAKITNQLIVVIAEKTQAEVTFWEKIMGKWQLQLKTSGYVGAAGIGEAKEGENRTPEGAFRLGQAFGKKDPGSKTPFRTLRNNDYWISNPESSDYNTWQSFPTSEMDEHLYAYVNKQYEFARVIHYNTNPIISGAGSAFFLHVENGGPTAGCVSVPRSVMKRLIKLTTEQTYIVQLKTMAAMQNY